MPVAHIICFAEAVEQVNAQQRTGNHVIKMNQLISLGKNYPSIFLYYYIKTTNCLLIVCITCVRESKANPVQQRNVKLTHTVHNNNNITSQHFKNNNNHHNFYLKFSVPHLSFGVREREMEKYCSAISFQAKTPSFQPLCC